VQAGARRKGLTVSEIHRLALEEYCLREMEPRRTSPYDDMIGVVDVPGDFSPWHKGISGDSVGEQHRNLSHRRGPARAGI